nr:MAG TPA: hypothetical protein [Caudoviricetes sp.]
MVPNWAFSRPTNTGRHSRIRKLKPNKHESKTL